MTEKSKKGPGIVIWLVGALAAGAAIWVVLFLILAPTDPPAEPEGASEQGEIEAREDVDAVIFE